MYSDFECGKTKQPAAERSARISDTSSRIQRTKNIRPARRHRTLLAKAVSLRNHVNKGARLIIGKAHTRAIASCTWCAKRTSWFRYRTAAAAADENWTLRAGGVRRCRFSTLKLANLVPQSRFSFLQRLKPRLKSTRILPTTSDILFVLDMDLDTCARGWQISFNQTFVNLSLVNRHYRTLPLRLLQARDLCLQVLHLCNTQACWTSTLFESGTLPIIHRQYSCRSRTLTKLPVWTSQWLD